MGLSDAVECVSSIVFGLRERFTELIETREKLGGRPWFPTGGPPRPA